MKEESEVIADPKGTAVNLSLTLSSLRPIVYWKMIRNPAYLDEIKSLGGTDLSRKEKNQGFICENCGGKILPLNNGSYRNHCPYCLHSKHVDIRPGDRKSNCKGLMQPVDLKYHSNKGYQIVHCCLICGEQQVNKVAENTNQYDDLMQLVQIKMKTNYIHPKTIAKTKRWFLGRTMTGKI